MRPKLKLALEIFKLGAFIEMVPEYESDSISPRVVFEITGLKIVSG